MTKLSIAAFAWLALFAFLLPAKADWVCDANTCYPLAVHPPVPVIVDVPEPAPAPTWTRHRPVHKPMPKPAPPKAEDTHKFVLHGKFIDMRSCAIIKEKGSAFSLLCR